MRATALLTPEATPACRAGAAASTVEVSGATTRDRPRPNTTQPGSTSEAYDAPGPTRRSSSTPPAQTSGPSVSGSRGPIRAASAPDRALSSSMHTVMGSNAVPAVSGAKPATTCRCTTSRKNTPPSAA